MKLLSGIFGRKTARAPAPELLIIAEDGNLTADQSEISDIAPTETWHEPEPVATPVPIPEVEPEADKNEGAVANPVDDTGVDDAITAALESAGAAGPGTVNIWDLEDDDEGDLDSFQDDVTIAPMFGASTQQRTEHDEMGPASAEPADGNTVGLIEDATKESRANRVEFPVGWVLVVDGPGRGNCFALLAGMSQIGRGEDQTVPLDFGDMAISRNNHAAIAYDAETRTFILGHGGKANIVRLNGQPVISNEDLADGDRIKIGNTTLQLKALCGKDFDWSDHEIDLEREDVAIA